jgi:hypothetical protein
VNIPQSTLRLPELTAIELEKFVTVEVAAEMLGIHPDTFTEHYPELIQKISPRCHRVKLRRLIERV